MLSYSKTVFSSISFLTCKRLISKRNFIQHMSAKRLAKSITLGFIFLQISFFLFSSSIETTNEKTNELDEFNNVAKYLEKNTWSKNGKYREERLMERQIKSFKDYSEHYKLGKRNQNNKIEKMAEEMIKDRVPENEQSDNDDKITLARVNTTKIDNKSGISVCPQIPPNLVGRLEFHFNSTPPTLKDVALSNPNLKNGGSYQPPDCVSRSRIAFIIPHRARELHLRALLWHVHPIFQRQQLYYKVYVVHQAGNLAFNKAKLMNIGFLEAMKDDDYDCVVFHDVDLLPEDDRLLYACKDTPKHLSVAIDKYSYRLPYSSLFGGVTMLSRDQFRDVNGYSNMYWGWGGEDDDMFNRIFSRGYTIKRPPLHLARYKMSFHHRDKGNRLNLMRYEILSRSVNRMHEDGLNNVKYRLASVEKTPIYTNITADVGTAVIECKPYLSQWTCSFVKWMCEHLTLSCGMLQYRSTDDGTLAIPLNTNIV